MEKTGNDGYETISVVKSYLVAPPGRTVVVTIPHELNPKPGTRFFVKTNGHRIVYEPVEDTK